MAGHQMRSCCHQLSRRAGILWIFSGKDGARCIPIEPRRGRIKWASSVISSRSTNPAERVGSLFDRLTRGATASRVDTKRNVPGNRPRSLRHQSPSSRIRPCRLRAALHRCQISWSWVLAATTGVVGGGRAMRRTFRVTRRAAPGHLARPPRRRTRKIPTLHALTCLFCVLL